ATTPRTKRLRVAGATPACSGGRASSRPAYRIPPATARAESGRRELLGGAHRGPYERLHVGKRLARVVAVVMHPLLEDVADREEAHLGMLAAPRQVAVAQPAHERGAVAAQRRQRLEQRGDLRGTQRRARRRAHIPTGAPSWPRMTTASPRCIALCASAVAPSRLARLTPCHSFSTQPAWGPKASAATARLTSRGAM